MCSYSIVVVYIYTVTDSYLSLFLSVYRQDKGQSLTVNRLKKGNVFSVIETHTLFFSLFAIVVKYTTPYTFSYLLDSVLNKEEEEEDRSHTTSYIHG